MSTTTSVPRNFFPGRPIAYVTALRPNSTLLSCIIHGNDGRSPLNIFSVLNKLVSSARADGPLPPRARRVARPLSRNDWFHFSFRGIFKLNLLSRATINRRPTAITRDIECTRLNKHRRTGQTLRRHCYRYRCALSEPEWHQTMNTNHYGQGLCAYVIRNAKTFLILFFFFFFDLVIYVFTWERITNIEYARGNQYFNLYT